MWDLDIFGAFGNLPDGRGDAREWAGDRTGDDDDADHNQCQSEAAEAGQNKRQLPVDLGLRGNQSAAFRIDFGERFEVFVQCGANGAVFVVVTPVAAGGGVDLHGAADQLFPKIDELFDAFLEGHELFGIVGL